jgi:hypothetical protein
MQRKRHKRLRKTIGSGGLILGKTCDGLRYFKRPWAPDLEDGRCDLEAIRITIVWELTSTHNGLPLTFLIARQGLRDAGDMVTAGALRDVLTESRCWTSDDAGTKSF